MNANQKLLALKGKIKWEGNLEEMRKSRFPTEWHMQIANTLNKILEYKHQEVLELQKKIPLSILKQKLKESLPKRTFFKNLEQHAKNSKIAIIAEIKKASPSLGVIQSDFDPIKIAKAYTEGGATCLSVLTEQHFFQGSPDYIAEVKAVSPLPVLRKDFIVDEYQIYESKVLGADAILLIVAALSDEQLKTFYSCAKQLDLDVLIEVHDATELKRALALKPRLLGINNRNLHTFEVSLNTTLELLPEIPKDTLVVSESGIHATEDVKKLSAQGVYTFLIGESLMRSKNPKEKLQELINDN